MHTVPERPPSNPEARAEWPEFKDIVAEDSQNEVGCLGPSPELSAYTAR